MLTAPEMTVLVGGLRVLGAKCDGSKHGVFTKTPGALTNDFFVNLLDMSTKWQKSATKGVLEGVTARPANSSGPGRWWTWSLVELAAPGPRGGLRGEGCEAKFVKDFAAAWTKVMNLDRFDLK